MDFNRLKLASIVCWLGALTFGVLLGIGIYRQKKYPKEKIMNSTIAIVMVSCIFIFISLALAFGYRSLSPSDYRLLRNL